MKKKQVFKRVATHLLKQNEVSTDGGGNQCMYKNGKGMFCAVGVLIDYEYYSWDLESLPADSVEVIKALNKSLDTKLTRKDTDLLICLQNIHDYASVDSWYEELEDLAVLTFSKTLEDLGVEA
tara:strand:+ start:748 stop:1116 length:369 start_codon:yes stop_codon:yes gene_type:complete